MFDMNNSAWAIGKNLRILSPTKTTENLTLILDRIIDGYFEVDTISRIQDANPNTPVKQRTNENLRQVSAGSFMTVEEFKRGLHKAVDLISDE